MEMSYNGALVMPCNYVAMDSNEMEYLEGGNGWYNSVDNVGIALDIAITCTAVGSAIKTGVALKALLKSNMGKKVTRLLVGQIVAMFGSAAGSVFTAALDIAFILTGSSIGNLIARGIDFVDSNRNNGYCFG